MAKRRKKKKRIIPKYQSGGGLLSDPSLIPTLGSALPVVGPAFQAISGIMAKENADAEVARQNQRIGRDTILRGAENSKNIDKAAKVAGFKHLGSKAQAFPFRMGGKMKYQDGGQLNVGSGGVGVPLSEDAMMIEGNSHEQGGVEVKDGQEPIAEVEGGEVVNDLQDGTPFVSSAVIINPETGNPFSEDMAMLEGQKGTVQKRLDKFSTKAEKEDRQNDRSLVLAMAKSEKDIADFDTQIETLAGQQEELKQQMMQEQQALAQQQQQAQQPEMGVDPNAAQPDAQDLATQELANAMPIGRMGGMLKKYPHGGPLHDEFGNPIYRGGRKARIPTAGDFLSEGEDLSAGASATDDEFETDGGSLPGASSTKPDPLASETEVRNEFFEGRSKFYPNASLNPVSETPGPSSSTGLLGEDVGGGTTGAGVSGGRPLQGKVFADQVEKAKKSGFAFFSDVTDPSGKFIDPSLISARAADIALEGDFGFGELAKGPTAGIKIPEFSLKRGVELELRPTPTTTAASPETVVEEEKAGLFSNIKPIDGKKLGEAAKKVTPFIDNVVNEALRKSKSKLITPRPAAQNFITPALLRDDAQKAAIDRENIASRRAILEQGSSAQTSNAALASTAGARFDAAARAGEDVRNLNQAERNRAAQTNAQIDAQNKNAQFQADTADFKRRESLISSISGNIGDASKDLQGIFRDEKAEKTQHAKNAQAFAFAEPRVQKALLEQYKTNPDLVQQLFGDIDPNTLISLLQEEKEEGKEGTEDAKATGATEESTTETTTEKVETGTAAFDEVKKKELEKAKAEEEAKVKAEEERVAREEAKKALEEKAKAEKKRKEEEEKRRKEAEALARRPKPLKRLGGKLNKKKRSKRLI